MLLHCFGRSCRCYPTLEAIDVGERLMTVGSALSGLLLLGLEAAVIAMLVGAASALARSVRALAGGHDPQGARAGLAALVRGRVQAPRAWRRAHREPR